MSVIRQQNWLGQQRVDIPHVRSIESSICADFDVLAGNIMAGLVPVIVKGFDAIATGAIGQPAAALQVNTAGSICMHPEASEAGSLFQVPSNRAVEVLGASNARVRGGFTSNTTNYVGFDLLRSADSSTADLVQFLNPQTNKESPKDVPLGRTLDYIFYISTQDFTTTPGVCPIAVVVTDSSNNVVSITDARNMFYRLGSGNSIPNALHTFPWANGRTEVGNNSDFSVADKSINSLKDWMDAMMTRVWELGGGQYWYSPTNVINVEMVRTGTPFTNGQFFEWDGANLHWKGLKFLFDNTVGWFNTVNNQTTDSPGLTNLADGDCIYVDIVRSSNATVNAVKGTLTNLGSPTIPGSRFVIAWRSGTDIFTRNSDFAVGTSFAAATTTALGVVKLSVPSATPSAPVVFNPGTNGELTVAATGGNVAGTTSTGNGAGAGGIFNGGGGNAVGVAGNGNGSGAGGVFQGGLTSGTGVAALGGGTGPGVDAYGSSAGSIAIQTNETAGKYNPQMVTRDSAGNVRTYWDHIGFPSGRRSEFREPWRYSGGTISAAGAIAVTGNMWSLQTNTGSLAMPQVPGLDTTYVASLVEFSNGGTATNKQSIYTTNATVFSGTNIVTIMEFEVAINASAKTNADTYFGVGITGGGDIAADTSYAYFKHAAGAGNWFAKSAGTVGSGNTDTGVAVTNSTITKFRIELHGTGTPGAGIARFFIGDSLTPVATHTVNWGAWQMFFVSFESVAVNTVVSQLTDVGEVLIQWNRWASPVGV